MLQPILETIDIQENFRFQYNQNSPNLAYVVYQQPTDTNYFKTHKQIRNEIKRILIITLARKPGAASPGIQLTSVSNERHCNQSYFDIADPQLLGRLGRAIKRRVTSYRKKMQK